MAPAIGLIVTGAKAYADFKIFVKTLEVWHPDAQLYVYSDSDTNLSAIKFKGKIHVKPAMDAYKGLTRKMMEAMPGVLYDSLFKDYTYEKANVITWILSEHKDAKAEGIWFMDADITHLAPLPVIPEYADIALSPHYIREADTRLFGKYNAGYMWFKNFDYIDMWRGFAKSSRFFEQAALEDVAAAAGVKLYEFPIQVNFGWWRMIQSPLAPPEVQKKFSIYRPDKSVGVRYDGAILQSVHTHWDETSVANGADFNRWFGDFIRKLASHPPMRNFIKAIGI